MLFLALCNPTCTVNTVSFVSLGYRVCHVVSITNITVEYHRFNTPNCDRLYKEFMLDELYLCCDVYELVIPRYILQSPALDRGFEKARQIARQYNKCMF